MTPKRREMTGDVTLDPRRVEHYMTQQGFNLAALVAKIKRSNIGFDRRTVKSVLAGNACRASTACLIGKALGFEWFEELLPTNDAEGSREDEYVELGAFGEWVVIDVLTDFERMPNGLQCELCKMQNRFDQKAFGRGKHYNLRRMNDDQRAEAERRLVRHSTICNRMGRQRAFPIHKRADYQGKHDFWIVDAWEEGTTLEERLKDGPLDPIGLRETMSQVAEALLALHGYEIVRRGLTPKYVLLREDDFSVLLTDLELAKLLDGSPPTPTDWKEDPYIAPEVHSGKCDVRTDLFSWAQILYHAAAGMEPEKIPEPTAFRGLRLPSGIQRIAAQCVERMPDDRPKSMKQVIKAIRKWK